MMMIILYAFLSGRLQRQCHTAQSILKLLTLVWAITAALQQQLLLVNSTHYTTNHVTVTT